MGKKVSLQDVTKVAFERMQDRLQDNIYTSTDELYLRFGNEGVFRQTAEKIAEFTSQEALFHDPLFEKLKNSQVDSNKLVDLIEKFMLLGVEDVNAINQDCGELLQNYYATLTVEPPRFEGDFILHALKRALMPGNENPLILLIGAYLGTVKCSLLLNNIHNPVLKNYAFTEFKRRAWIKDRRVISNLEFREKLLKKYNKTQEIDMVKFFTENSSEEEREDFLRNLLGPNPEVLEQMQKIVRPMIENKQFKEAKSHLNLYGNSPSAEFYNILVAKPQELSSTHSAQAVAEYQEVLRTFTQNILVKYVDFGIEAVAIFGSRIGNNYIGLIAYAQEDEEEYADIAQRVARELTGKNIDETAHQKFTSWARNLGYSEKGRTFITEGKNALLTGAKEEDIKALFDKYNILN